MVDRNTDGQKANGQKKMDKKTNGQKRQKDRQTKTQMDKPEFWSCVSSDGNGDRGCRVLSSHFKKPLFLQAQFSVNFSI